MSQSLTFQNHNVRINIENNQVMFVAKDVCAALNISWSGSKILGNIPESWKGVVKLPTPRGGVQKHVTINEAATYKLAFRSNKPEADAFTNWVASEVLPSIRKTGSYKVQEQPLPLPATDQTEMKLDMLFVELSSLIKAAFSVEKRIYALTREAMRPALKHRHTKAFSIAVHAHTATDSLWYSMDKQLEALQDNCKVLVSAGKL